LSFEAINDPTTIIEGSDVVDSGDTEIELPCVLDPPPFTESAHKSIGRYSQMSNHSSMPIYPVAQVYNNPDNQRKKRYIY